MIGSYTKLVTGSNVPLPLPLPLPKQEAQNTQIQTFGGAIIASPSDSIVWTEGSTHPDYATKEARLKTFQGWEGDHDPKKLAESSFYYTGSRDITRCFFCQAGVTSWTSTDDPWVEHARWSPSCLYLISIKGKPFVDAVQRKEKLQSSVDARLESFFTNKWPLSFEQTPQTMAEAGFYMTGKGGRHVRCCFCDVNISNWQPDIDPWLQHALLSPKCSHFLDEVGQEFVDRLQLINQFRSFNGRLKSFVDKKWPKHLEQTPEIMAEAGLYMTHTGHDHVQCFYCGAGGSQWNAGDVPFDEHAKWSPSCAFVLKKKGQQLIDDRPKQNSEGL